MISDFTRTRFDTLSRYLQEHSDPGRWLVLTHDNPDPDALAAAVMLGRLLQQGLGQRVTLAYSGLIGRAENREMVRSLKLHFSLLRHLNLKRYKHFALVDTQPRTGNNSLPADITPDLVIDHHPARRPSASVPLADIRPEYGATATIVAEYLQVAGVSLSRNVATALVYAIRSETQDFGREGSDLDKQVYDAFLPRANKRLLGRIQHAPLPLAYYGMLHQALENLQGVHTLVVSHLGTVEQPDIVPEIADLLLRMEGMTWSLCTGVYGDRVYLSIRTTNPRAAAGDIARRLVGRRGRGGGHGMLAGGWVQLTATQQAEPERVQQQLGRKLAKALRKNPDKLGPVDFGLTPREQASWRRSPPA